MSFLIDATDGTLVLRPGQSVTVMPGGTFVAQVVKVEGCRFDLDPRPAYTVGPQLGRTFGISGRAQTAIPEFAFDPYRRDHWVEEV